MLKQWWLTAFSQCDHLNQDAGDRLPFLSLKAKVSMSCLFKRSSISHRLDPDPGAFWRISLALAESVRSLMEMMPASRKMPKRCQKTSCALPMFREPICWVRSVCWLSGFGFETVTKLAVLISQVRRHAGPPQSVTFDNESSVSGTSTSPTMDPLRDKATRMFGRDTCAGSLRFR